VEDRKKNYKVKNGYAQKYCVSPEEEKEGYGGKDSQKTKVLSLE